MLIDRADDPQLTEIVAGARVLAHSVRRQMSTKWPIEMVALVDPAKLTPKWKKDLQAIGYRVVPAALQFDSSQIKNHPIARDTLKKEIDKSGKTTAVSSSLSVV